MNLWLGVGRLGKDPELRGKEGGTAVCTFDLACETSFRTRDGEHKKHTEWVRIVVFGKQGEQCSKSLAKGSLAQVRGELRSRSYEKNGTKVWVTEVRADDVTFLSGKQPAQPVVDAGEYDDEHPPF